MFSLFPLLQHCDTGWLSDDHDIYTDPALELERVEQAGQTAWERLLKAHYADCPAAG